MDDHHDPLLETDGRYVRIQTLGKGSFGFVVQARNSVTKEVVAIKLLPRIAVNSKYVEAEIVNHSLMRHPHVIQFKEVFLTRQFICIVMEYATGGTLFQYVQKQGRLKEAVARWFFQQLLVGVDYCHKRGVANRDIKLENTLLQAVPRLPLPLVKICDFGYSKAENKSAAKSKVGTLTYMAPEVLINITRGQYDGKVADIWSCGVMLYVMLCGKYPFDSPNSAGVIATPTDFISMLERMVGRQFTIPADIHASADCQDLLRRMLLPEPHNRITVEGIMAHPWYCTNLPPEASSMNTAYLKTAPPAGVPSPEAIRKLLEEARTGCRAYAWPSNHQHSASVASLGPRVTPAQPVLAPGAAAQPPAAGMPVAAREPAGNFGAQAEAAARMQQQQQQQLVQVQVLHPPMLVADAPPPQSALGPGMMAVDAYQQHAGMLQQQQQQFMPAVPFLQLQPQQQQQQQSYQFQQQQLPRPDVPDEVVMMIDAAISDQFRAGQSAASQELRAYFMAATSRVS